MFTDQSQEAKTPVFFIPAEDVNMITPAIRFIYGSDFPEKPKTLYRVAGVVAIAEKYEIADLLVWAIETAVNLMAGCLSDEAKLKDFLAFGQFRVDSPTSGLMHDFAFDFIQKNLKKLQGTGAFQDLVENEPKLTVMLLNAVVYEMK